LPEYWCPQKYQQRECAIASLAAGRSGERRVVYDNERGKGDHRHVEGKEEPYSFSTPEQLIADFLADVRRLRGES
jgi:hypothetical protein